MSVILYTLGAMCICGGVFAVVAMSAPIWVLLSVPAGVALIWAGVSVYIRQNPLPDPPPQLRRSPPSYDDGISAITPNYTAGGWNMKKEYTDIKTESLAADQRRDDVEELRNQLDSLNYKVSKMATQLEDIQHYTRRTSSAVVAFLDMVVKLSVVTFIAALVVTILVIAFPFAGVAAIVVASTFLVAYFLWLASTYLKREFK